ncbi:MAG TPA: HIT domain-containing protein [Candidatus Paceibacterota bacterium]
MAEDFSKNLIADFKHWTLYIYTNQGYLGRCVIWCKREGAMNLEDATLDEMEEFLEIIRKLKTAVQKSFQADWFNYAFLANATIHLHCHFVPRYKTERELNGTRFKDELWGHNYKTDKSFVTSTETLQKVKATIIENLI